eukprot:gene8094-309_t
MVAPAISRGRPEVTAAVRASRAAAKTHAREWQDTLAARGAG